MKKIGKFLINPEKVVKHDDLLKIRGGYGEGGYGGYDYPCSCTCFDADKFIANPNARLDCLGYVFSEDNCVRDCQVVFGMRATGECGNNRLCF